MLSFLYWTSRGFTVADINYGGSTGYGAAYRHLLDGQWGVVDFEDVITVVQQLVAQGVADPRRTYISGGSAGGFTVLNALVHSDVFAAGADYYGVAELTMLAQDTHDFEFRRGPVFTNFLLADEVNRAPAKTQAALLEVMQERQVTLEGRALAAPQPFLVMATQNPIEQEGTYPLPEAELDRFMLMLRMDYPQADEELALVSQVTRSVRTDILDVSGLRVLLQAKDVQALQKIASDLPLDDQVLDYAVRLARATRSWPGLSLGAGPRASIALVRCARARALLRGGDFVVPDDVKGCALAVLRHRVRLSPELDIEGTSVDQLLQRGWAVYPVAPTAAARYRERKVPSGTKTDRHDSWALADALQIGRAHV